MKLEQILNYTISFESVQEFLAANDWAVGLVCTVLYILGYLTLGKYVGKRLAKWQQKQNKAHYPAIYSNSRDGLDDGDRFVVVLCSLIYPFVLTYIFVVNGLLSIVWRTLTSVIPNKE